MKQERSTVFPNVKPRDIDPVYRALEKHNWFERNPGHRRVMTDVDMAALVVMLGMLCVAHMGPAALGEGDPASGNAMSDWEKSVAVAPLVRAEISTVFLGLGVARSAVAEVLPGIVPDSIMDRATALIALVPGANR